MSRTRTGLARLQTADRAIPASTTTARYQRRSVYEDCDSGFHCL